MADDTTETVETTPDPTAERLSRLEADLARERAERAAERQSMQDTLRTLRPNVDAGSSPVPLPPRATLQRISDESGIPVEDVARHYGFVASMFNTLAEPVLRGVNGMADVLDLVQTRQEVSDYETIADAADRKRQESISQGRFITRKQATALVKAERLADPKYRETIADEVVAARTKAAEAAAARTAAQAAAGGTDVGAGSQGAAPSPHKQPAAVLTKEAFEKLPLEKMRETLANVTL